MEAEKAKWVKILADRDASVKAIDNAVNQQQVDIKLVAFTKSRKDAAQKILDDLNTQKTVCASVDDCSKLIPQLTTVVNVAATKVADAGKSADNIKAKQVVANNQLTEAKNKEATATKAVSAKNDQCTTAKADADKKSSANAAQMLFLTGLKTDVNAKLTDTTARDKLIALLSELYTYLENLGKQGVFSKDYTACVAAKTATEDKALETARSTRDAIEKTITGLATELKQTQDLQVTLAKASTDAQSNLNTNSARCKSIANARLGIKTLSYRGPQYFQIERFVLDMGDGNSGLGDGSNTVGTNVGANLLDIDASF